MDHPLGFRRGQAVELPRVAVGDQDVNARPDRPVDDGRETIRSNLVPVVERRDQDA
jgi:hypothetical protein